MSVRNALLGLLTRRPCHGYELHAAFEALAGGRELWEVKPAQVYTTLTRLAEGGLIVPHETTQDGGPERLVYAITAAGRAELAHWLITPVAAQHQRDEFFLKLMLSVATDAAEPRRVIAAQRASLYRDLHATTMRRALIDPARTLAQIMLLDRTLMHIEADIRWLDMLEARIDDIRRQPLPEPSPRPRGRPPRT
ncbi:MAG TPA: PadR family transcriptional regulator [Roseiflexaceae bacterium]|nr:PadR family transcriptional regulator [Roseiflexaceae bacterium]HMP40934.1 PadR family transcriptional regulator [Roseiflexaceae bacterium]